MPEGPEAAAYAAKLAAQEKKRKEARDAAKRGGGGASGSSESAAKKPRVDLARALDTPDPNASQLKLPLPFTLKKVLVEDWERCSQMDPQMLVPLPRDPCVADIVAQFLELRAKKGNAVKLSELFEGLVLYFDAALPVTLLYAKERHQYYSVSKAHPGLPPSKIYGAEHLLRLFTKLPQVLGNAPMATVEASQLQNNLTEFLKHIQKNSASLFSSQYVVQTGVPSEPEAKAGTAGGAAEK